MRQYAIPISLAVIVISSLVCGGPAYDKWSAKSRPQKNEPTVKDYDKVIADMEKGMTELRRERLDVLHTGENETFVSVWALRTAMKTVGDSGIHSYDGEWGFMVIGGEDTWKDWIDKARELDKENPNTPVVFSDIADIAEP